RRGLRRDASIAVPCHLIEQPAPLRGAQRARRAREHVSVPTEAAIKSGVRAPHTRPPPKFPRPRGARARKRPRRTNRHGPRSKLGWKGEERSRWPPWHTDVCPTT